MKHHPRFLVLAAATGLLLCCDSKEAGSPSVQTSAPEPPSAEVRAALEAQPVGRRLLGNTMALVGDDFVQADLRKAPEYYLIHYSASY